MEEFSFPQPTSATVSSRILEVARRPKIDISSQDHTTPATVVEPGPTIDVAKAANLIAQARNKAAVTKWLHFSPAVRRQPRVNELIFRALSELTKLLRRLNAPLHKLSERVDFVSHQAIVAQERMRDVLETDYQRREAIASLQETLREMQKQQQEEFAGLRNALEAIQAKLPAPIDRFDELYLELEEEFRGSEQEVRERLLVYPPYLEKLEAHGREISLLDLGCGRGEWLSLLRDKGYPAQGIDINEKMVARCASRGLDVCKGDLLEHLRNQSDRSFAVVTAFHVVEHLRFDQFIELLDQSLRVLEPGGMAIFETPNPESLLVSSRSFYLDPTHNKPLPPKLFEFLLRARGFASTEILKLQPVPEAGQIRFEGTSKFADAFNALFYGSQDYGIIARKNS